MRRLRPVHRIRHPGLQVRPRKRRPGGAPAAEDLLHRHPCLPRGATRAYKFDAENGVPAERLPQKTFYIGTLVSREERVARIDRRLDERLEDGLVEEIQGLLDSGIPADDLLWYGLEYKFVTQYVLGKLSYDEMHILLANAIHQFAKRQMTWFRGMERDGVRIHWVRP